MGRGKFWWKRHHCDDCFVHQCVGFPEGWISAENKEDLGATGWILFSMRTGTRGEHGTKV